MEAKMDTTPETMPGTTPNTTPNTTPDPMTDTASEGAANTSIEAPILSGAAKSDPPTYSTDRGFRFWAILAALSFACLPSALEATITSTALPTMIADLGGGDLYVWAVNGYFLAM